MGQGRGAAAGGQNKFLQAGQVGVVGHARIGAGAQVAGGSNIAGDVPAGARYGGTPAKPIRQWFREVSILGSLAKKGGAGEKTSEDGTA